MRPPDDGPTTPVKITPEDFHRAAEAFMDSSKGMFRLHDRLWDGLVPAAGWAGVDKQALDFGGKFSAALTPVFMGFIAASMVLGDIAAGIDSSAYNHWRADQAATPGGGAADPPWTPVDPGLTLNPEPAPFPMTGNATHTLPGYLQEIVPLGDQNKLWAAAQVFYELRDDLDGISAGLRGTLQNLFANNTSGDLTALDEFWDRVGGLNNDKAILTALRDACDRLGHALDDFATWMKDVKDQIENAVVDVLKNAALGVLIGLVLAALSEGIGGLGDVFAIADAAGEGGAVVGAVTGVLEATNVAGRLAAIGGAAGAVHGLMQVAIEETPSPNLGQPTDPAAVTDEQIEVDTKHVTDRINTTTPEHYHELGYDPATKQFRPGEADTGVLIENTSGVRLSRASERSGVDWRGSDGKTYDAVGPVPRQFFDQQWKNIQDQIIKHIGKADYVPINVSGLSSEQVAVIKQFTEPLGPKVFLVGE